MASKNINTIVEDVIKEWECAFPGLITSWYLIGSHVDKTAVRDSDIDLFFVLNTARDSENDSKNADLVIQRLKQRWPINIECWGQTVEYLNSLERTTPPSRELIHTVSIKLGSQILRGRDIRPEIVLPAMKAYVSALVSIAKGWIKNKNELATSTDPYLSEKDGNTKRFVQIVLSCAAAVIARKAGVYIPRKSEVRSLYCTYINDDWNSLIIAAHEFVWQKWQYDLPTNRNDQAFYRKLCEQAVDFERIAADQLSI